MTTVFATRITQRLSLLEQELLTFPWYLSSPPVFSGGDVPQSLDFFVVFYRSLFVFNLLAIVLSVLLFWPLCCLLSFGHGIVCPSIYGY
jgi:hypothetical protein